MDAQIVWKMIFGLVGGLGIFLLGMKNMSEGMQAVAGGGLRRMIGAVTNNRLMATGVGTLVTCIVQSSSITTVMVVGFVNSGLMTLVQAVGVIMGANIGTTITGWILVLKIGKYGLPILGLAAFTYLFSRNEKRRYLAMAVMGVGMVFFGLELMKGACGHIKDLPEFEEWLQRFRADNLFGVLKCLAVGCVLTMAVQSSSATLGLTIALAVKGVIPYETAAALVLGENIGTTITALLASLGTTTNAKRAAYFHCLFNVSGVIWITTVFFLYVQFVPWFLNEARGLVGMEAIDLTRAVVENNDNGNETVYPDTTIAIAATHSIFNIVNMLIFLPFGVMIAAWLTRIIPDRAIKEKPHLTSLDMRMLETPMIAIEQSRTEVLRMAEGCDKMMVWLRELLGQDEPDRKLVQKVFHREEVLDKIQDEVVDFMTHLLAGTAPLSVIEEGRSQLRMADEYESISDYIRSILKFHLKLRKQGQRFSEAQLAELLELHDQAYSYLQLVNDAARNQQREVITKAHSLGSQIKHSIKSLRSRHLDELTEEKIAPQINLAYTSALTSYRRVYDHALNVAEAVAGEK